MTAQPAPSQRVVTLPNKYPGYWQGLLGVRMPACVENDRVQAGVLRGVRETTEETVELTFSDLALEG